MTELRGRKLLLLNVRFNMGEQAAGANRCIEKKPSADKKFADRWFFGYKNGGRAESARQRFT
jgi:hypothetical protein